VIKVERPGVGDITRGQLQDVPMSTACISPCSITTSARSPLDTKNPKGKEVLTALIKSCDVAGGKFRSRRARSHGISREKIQAINRK